jgi:hypothetical protein
MNPQSGRILGNREIKFGSALQGDDNPNTQRNGFILTRHLIAMVRTFTADYCTSFAMLIVMLRAFFCAGFTYLCT